MKLKDAIYRQSTEETVPAYVFTTNSAGDARFVENPVGPDLFAGYELDSTLRVIVGPGGEWEINEGIEWGGKQYWVGYVAKRVRHGKEHHTTLTMANPQSR